jgi:hypothetical protein
MKLTVFSLVILFLVVAFAGVQPFSLYKDKAMSYFSTLLEAPPVAMVGTPESTVSMAIPPVLTRTLSPLPPSTPAVVTPKGIDTRTGIYGNYFLGLVKTPDGVLGGNDCYGEFLVLINNKNATDPTYLELLAFLKRDGTDQFPYRYSASVGSSYYGSAESHIDLAFIRDIIDGKSQPSDPMICADFAERLHNEAEANGIRCAYVSLDMIGYTDPYGYGIASDAGHALVAFNTSDRGLVYIDDTGKSGYGPMNCDKIVDVQIGQEYVPRSLFPEVGWSDVWDSMGTVTGIYMTWDGNWNN